MAQGFAATGTVKLTFTGSYPPTGSRLNFIVTAGTLPCTPAQAQAKLYFIHVDHLNTPRLIADEQQRTVWRWDNTDPFGGNPPDENPSGLGTFEFPLRFPGQYADHETGLRYSNQRDAYDSATSRFLQPDPLGILTTGAPTINPALSHLYAYVDSDPLGFVDPDGLAKQRGGGNPRPSSGMANQGAWVGQQGVWFRGQFYPRFGEPIVSPASALPRSQVWRDPGQICIPENQGFPQPISGHALQNWISRPDRDIPARDIINAIRRGYPDLNSRPGTVTYYDASTNTTVITNIFTGGIISFRRGVP
jgi:RHS repeat-associated protein